MIRRAVWHQAILPTVVLALLLPVLSISPTASAAVELGPGGVEVFFTSSGQIGGPVIKHLDDSLLRQWFIEGTPTDYPVNISGRNVLFFRAEYAASAPDLLGTSAQVYYTIDGSPPRKSGANFSISRATTDTTSTPTQMVYVGSLPSANLVGAVRFRFMIQINDIGGDPTACDFGRAPADGSPAISQSPCPSVAPLGSGFQFHVDRTRPVLDLTTIVPRFFQDVWSNGMIVTGNNSFELAFNITDESDNEFAFNAPLDPATLNIGVTFRREDGNNVTIDLFDPATPPNEGGQVGNRLVLNYTNGGFQANFTWNRAGPFWSSTGANVWWDNGTTPQAKWGTNGNYTLFTDAADYAGNDVLITRAHTLHVDTRPPRLTLDPLHTYAQPAQDQEDVRGNVVTVIGVGTQVHVQVNITDWTTNISRTNTSAVRVHLENTTFNVRTTDAPLFFNNTVIRGHKNTDTTAVTTVNQYKGLLNVTHFLNSTTGAPIPAPTANMTLRYNFTVLDSAGNRCPTIAGHPSGCISAPAFLLKPGLPVVTVTELSGVSVGGTRYVQAGPYPVVARATDVPEGIQSVTLTIRNETGRFLDLTGWTRVNDNTFQRSMTPISGSANNYSRDIPAAENKTRILYNVSAQDQVGNVARFPTTGGLIAVVDTQAPVLQETLAKPWRAGTPHNLTFGVLDDGSGPNGTSGFLNYRIGTSGSFTNRSMDYSAGATGAGIFSGLVTGTVAHQDTVEYFTAAADAVGNWAANGSSASPLSYRVDLVKPVASLNATPASTDTGKFRLSGLGTDADSGVRSFIFEGQFKSPGATAFSGWIQVQEITLAAASASQPFSSDELCLIGGGVTYQFRAVAVDDAGNRADPTAPSTTEVPGLGCEGDLVITISQPAPGSLVDAQGGSATKSIQYRATATGSFVSDSLILIKIEFSPDDGTTYVTLGQNLPNTGNYTWIVNAPTCSQCRIRVTGTLPDGTVESQVSDRFEVIRGNRLVDFDGNDLGDSCELESFGALGVADPDADPDRDGLTTRQECAFGTDPTDADSDDDGVEDGVEIRLDTNPLDAQSKPSQQSMRYTQWGEYVWIVPVLFALVTIVFLVGLARRW